MTRGGNDDQYCSSNRPAPRGTPGCTEPSPETGGSYCGSRTADSRFGRNRPRGTDPARQAHSFRGRTPENFPGSKSALGQNPANQESSITQGRAVGCVQFPRDAARLVFVERFLRVPTQALLISLYPVFLCVPLCTPW